jgi:hypothetical protein
MTSPAKTMWRTKQDPSDQKVRVVALRVLLRHIVASRLSGRWHLARILLILRLDRFRKSLLGRLLLLAWWRVRRVITFLRLMRSCHLPAGWLSGHCSYTVAHSTQRTSNDIATEVWACERASHATKGLRCKVPYFPYASQLVLSRALAGQKGWKLRKHRRHGGQHPACYTGYDTVTHHQLVVLLYACMQDCCLASRLMHATAFRARNDGSQGRVGAAHAQCTGR